VPAARVDVVHVATPAALTDTVPQPVIVAPFAVKVTFPDGAIGVNAMPVPVSVAVNVTDAPAAVELDGAAPSDSPAANAETVWVIAGCVATVKFASPE
jgi:hypothetical protein